MAKKRRRMTTPEEDAAFDERTRRMNETLTRMDERFEAARREREARAQRRRRWRSVFFRFGRRPV